MLYVDTKNVLFGLLFLTATCSGKDPKDVHLKRNPSAKSEESLLVESSEERPSRRYSDEHYEANRRQEPKDEFNDPDGDYGRAKDEEVPHAYHFGYEVNDEKEGHQYRHEQKDEKGNVQGQFGYRDAKGQFRQVEYVADNHGFRAKVKTNEAGVENQNPADVELHKEEGQDFQKEYTKNVYTGHSGDEKVQHSDKSSSSNYYHQEPTDEGKSHMARSNYYQQPQVESEPYGASHYYHRQPVENKQHVASNEYYRQSEVKREPHLRLKHHHRQPVEGESSEEYKRQPVVESEPHANHYEYEPKSEHPYATYENYGYPHNAEQEPNRYQKNQNEEPEMPAVTNQYYKTEQDSQTDNGYSPEKHHSMPRTEIYKKENKIVPPQPYVEKSLTRAPATYQYELQMDGKTYKYVKKPLPSEHENEKSHQAYYTKGSLQVMEEPDLRNYEETAKENGGENYDSGEQKLILPQTGANEYNVHSYPNAYPYHNNPSNQDNSNEENGAAKYDYNGYSLSGHSKEVEPEMQVVPEAHQYVQIDENQLSNPDVSYRQQYVPREQRVVEPQHIVMIDSRKTEQMKENVIAYREPQTSSLPALAYKSIRNEHQPMKKAVLELNPQVYKKLLQNKSPGQSIVAIPVNGRHTENSGPSAEPPHGVLHITLDENSAFNPNAAPIVFQIGNQESPSPVNTGHRHRLPIPFPRSHHTYAQSSATPMYKPKNHRQKDTANWVPVTQAWRQRTGRTSANGDSMHVSNGEGFKFLQVESSNRKVNLQRQPPKVVKSSPLIHKRVIPGIYIINTTKRVSKSKDSKSTQGHALISLTTP